MTKYKEYCLRMFKNHEKDFEAFRPIHDKFMLDTSKHQTEFNEKGKKILNIVKEWEDKLCSRSEGNGYAAFTEKLAEKFNLEVKKEFPMIDRVGLVMKKMKPVETKPVFAINKINLETTNSDNFGLKKIGL